MLVCNPGAIIPIIIAQQTVLGCMMQERDGECRTKFVEVCEDGASFCVLRADADRDWMRRVRAGNWWDKIRDDFRRYLNERDYKRIDLYEEGVLVRSWPAKV